MRFLWFLQRCRRRNVVDSHNLSDACHCKGKEINVSLVSNSQSSLVTSMYLMQPRVSSQSLCILYSQQSNIQYCYRYCRLQYGRWQYLKYTVHCTRYQYQCCTILYCTLLYEIGTVLFSSDRSPRLSPSKIQVKFRRRAKPGTRVPCAAGIDNYCTHYTGTMSCQPDSSSKYYGTYAFWILGP